MSKSTSSGSSADRLMTVSPIRFAVSEVAKLSVSSGCQYSWMPPSERIWAEPSSEMRTIPAFRAGSAVNARRVSSRVFRSSNSIKTQAFDRSLRQSGRRLPKYLTSLGAREGEDDASNATIILTASKTVISGAFTPLAPVVNRPASRKWRTINLIVFSLEPSSLARNEMSSDCFMLNVCHALRHAVKSKCVILI